MFPNAFFPASVFPSSFFPRPSTVAVWAIFDAFQSALIDAGTSFAGVDPNLTVALAATDATPDDFAAIDPNRTIALTSAEVAS